jgi:YbbR domain-containing protein
LDIDSLSGKKVKILPEISLNFEQGYQLRDSLKISPKEISVYGPSEVLDTLQYVYTQRKSLTNLKENFTLDLGLKKPKAAKLQLETNQVHIVGLVDRFTEKEFKLPVRFINVPAGVTLKVFPEEVPVLVRGSLEDLKKIKNSDFDLVCDFDALQPTTTFASTFLKRAPMSITIVDIKDENLQVLIKEK